MSRIFNTDACAQAVHECLLERVDRYVTEVVAILYGQSLTTAAQRTDVGDAMAFKQR